MPLLFADAVVGWCVNHGSSGLGTREVHNVREMGLKVYIFNYYNLIL